MKKVLIVDDSKLVRNFFLKKLERYQDRFEVRVAENGSDAVNIMKNFHPHLVMTDLEMPIMDGFELLAYMHRNNPDIPMYVMTAKGTPEVEKRINAMGSIRYFEKPLDIDMLAESITSDVTSDGAKGKLQGIMLVSFLQLIEVEGKSCTLTVTSRNRTGTLSCVNGRLINAQLEDLKGLEAAYELISWDNAIIEIVNTVNNRAEEIKLPLVSVIMEGLSRKDEKTDS